jgi:hypothetical protein
MGFGELLLLLVVAMSYANFTGHVGSGPDPQFQVGMAPGWLCFSGTNLLRVMM